MVAALTIPTLISNYQKNQYVTQLKKNYNVIQNGFRQYMATQGVTKLTDTKLFNLINGDSTDTSDQSAFQTELNNIFKITKQYENNQLTKEDYPRYTLNGSSFPGLRKGSYFFLTDGSIVNYVCYKNEELSHYTTEIKDFNTKMKSQTCNLFIDVNGLKKPNILGRDIFQFFLDNQGTLFPRGGKDISVYQYGNYGDNRYDPCDKESGGYGCAARIIEEGWKMTY